MKSSIIAPSILSADFGKLNEEIASVDNHADLIHCDVMDGCFVPNITFGNEVIKNIKCSKPLDVHLMIARPEKHIEAFAKCNEMVEMISFHLEATRKAEEIIKEIRGFGLKAGIAIKPRTPAKKIFPFLKKIDFVLVMTVEPGFGGQKFIAKMIPKIEEIRKKAPEIDIEVDGGINEQTAPLAVKAGANILVSGSAIFAQKDREEAISRIKTAAEI
ncbi:MAG: ribulose-phosphate 3-epimerase [Candidatus Diapherotrites archaeon]|nr:ribulose-phosphate 3-epimerase [Candidatus Diapherotrites archaeon]